MMIRHQTVPMCKGSFTEDNHTVIIQLYNNYYILDNYSKTLLKLQFNLFNLAFLAVVFLICDGLHFNNIGAGLKIYKS